MTYIKINKETTRLWCDIDPTAQEYVDERGELLLELDKFIYGLKQSPLKFQQHLTKVLLKLGYRQTENDECMFIKHGRNGLFSALTVHVDDILQVCTSDALYQELHDGLIEAYGTITAHPGATSYLGMTITRSRCKGYIQLSQRGLIQKVAEEYPAEEGTGGRCPTAARDSLFDVDASDKTAELNEREKSKYLGLVMTLMYLARLTRPDVLLAVTFLATRTHNCHEEDRRHAMRVVRYLERTAEDNLTIHCTDLQIYLHCDASFGTHRKEGKGHTGFFAAFGKDPSYIHARSAKQKLCSTSSTEAEILALSDAVKLRVWLRNLLTELQVTSLQQLCILQDNKSVLNVIDAKRTKHLINRFCQARALIKSQVMRAEHIGTEELSADALTKPLQGSAHAKHTSVLMGHGWAKQMVDENRKRHSDSDRAWSEEAEEIEHRLRGCEDR